MSESDHDLLYVHCMYNYCTVCYNVWSTGNFGSANIRSIAGAAKIPIRTSSSLPDVRSRRLNRSVGKKSFHGSYVRSSNTCVHATQVRSRRWKPGERDETCILYAYVLRHLAPSSCERRSQDSVWHATLRRGRPDARQKRHQNSTSIPWDRQRYKSSRLGNITRAVCLSCLLAYISRSIEHALVSSSNQLEQSRRKKCPTLSTRNWICTVGKESMCRTIDANRQLGIHKMSSKVIYIVRLCNLFLYGMIF